jgi:hypothetical protein
MSMPTTAMWMWTWTRTTRLDNGQAHHSTARALPGAHLSRDVSTAAAVTVHFRTVLNAITDKMQGRSHHTHTDSHTETSAMSDDRTGHWQAEEPHPRSRTHTSSYLQFGGVAHRLLMHASVDRQSPLTMQRWPALQLQKSHQSQQSKESGRGRV